MIAYRHTLCAIKWCHFVLQVGTAPCIVTQYPANSKSLGIKQIARRCILVQ